MRKTSFVILVFAVAAVLLAEPLAAQGRLGGAGAARGGFGGARGGGLGGAGARGYGSLPGGFRQNSPTFRPAPSLTPFQALRPAPSLSPALNFNPAPSLFRPQRPGDASRGSLREPNARPSQRVAFPAPLRAYGPPAVVGTSGGAPTPAGDATDPVNIQFGNVRQPASQRLTDEFTRAVRSRFAANQDIFTRRWFESQSETSAWHAKAIADTAWKKSSWFAVKFWLRIETTGFPYLYGTNVVFRNDAVLVGDRVVATKQEFREKAIEIAKGRRQPENEKALWMPLGVFAVVRSADPAQAEEAIQLSTDMSGMIRGTNWNIKEQQGQTIAGRVDTSTLRAVWRVRDNESLTYEAGIFNLTGDAVPLLIHDSSGTTQHALLIRLTN